MEPENVQRAATDILLSIESKLDVLEKRCQNSENLLKLLLGRFNQFLPSSQKQSVSQPSIPEDIVVKNNFDNRPKTDKFIQLAAKQGIVINDKADNIPKNIITAVPQFNDDVDTMTEAKVRGNVRGQRGPKIEGGKSSVSQMLTGNNNVPLFLANIEILNENNELINQTRTNTKGRWLTALAPGNYQVHVVKNFPADSGKKTIDTTYEILVPSSAQPVELSPLSFDNG